MCIRVTWISVRQEAAENGSKRQKTAVNGSKRQFEEPSIEYQDIRIRLFSLDPIGTGAYLATNP